MNAPTFEADGTSWHFILDRMHPTTRRSLTTCTLLLLWFGLIAITNASGQTLHSLDLLTKKEAQRWKATHDIKSLSWTSTGLRILSSGDDPYITGPALDFAPRKELWFRIRLRSRQAGTAQLFHFSRQKFAEEANSIRFPVPGQDQWTEIRVALPPLGPETLFRFDPPGTTNNVVTIAWIKFDDRVNLSPPQWPKVQAPALTDPILKVQSGALELRHAANRYGAFIVSVENQSMAIGWSNPLIGYTINGKARWFSLSDRGQTSGKTVKRGLLITTTARDEDGANWTIRQKFEPQQLSGAIDIQTEVEVSQKREVIFLPMFFVLPGVRSFGEAKNQALFAGLEYLDNNEPSSSEADIVGDGSHRQAPDTGRITIPFMALQNGGRWVALSWDSEPSFAAVFDSPDRLFRSGGHVMGLIFPGSDGGNRSEGNLLPYTGQSVEAGKRLRLSATLSAGSGESVVPAIQDYITRRGLPAIPHSGYDLQGYIRLAASGWLDSRAREGDKFRHAFPGSFDLGPAADAVTYMDWLGRYSADSKLSERLKETAAGARAILSGQDYWSSSIGHIRPPVAPLVYAHAESGVVQARENARKLLSQFKPDGSIPYQTSLTGLDYGKTHFAPDANGLTAQVIASELESAAFSGDKQLIEDGLRFLRALNKFDGTVPRGAQTWEVPLHAPDLLAAANLVRSYTLGYELTGDKTLLERAQYWAWTGIPFVYLRNPTKQLVGPFATIAVLGATHWTATNWMGLPVQWCGLVYANAISELFRYDANPVWKRVADGIIASGIQQTWPIGQDRERQGMLPDSFALQAQSRNDVAINPGTLQATAPFLYGLPPMYALKVFRESGFSVHAPGGIRTKTESTKGAVFTVEGWPAEAYELLLSGLRAKPVVKVKGRETPVEFFSRDGVATVTLRGTVEVAVSID